MAILKRRLFMDYLMAFVSIIAIIAIIIVGGGLIAFLCHMIVGVFDKDRTPNSNNNDLLDYTQYKQLENPEEQPKNLTDEYNFEAINAAKAEEEQKLAGKEEEDVFKLLDEEEDVNPEEMEKKLAETKTEPAEIVAETKVEEAKPQVAETDEEDFELDNLLDEISNDVEEEVKAENQNEVKMSDELESYSIDDILNQVNEEEMQEETTEAVEETEETPVEENVEENNNEEIVETTTTTVEEVVDEASQKEIEELKAKVAELNKKLSEATTRTSVVTVDMTEEECLARLATLEERLKTAKKDYRINQKEYRPLKKIMNELERNQIKLRRKDAVVAKQKVALYGVNNYVDIDKEKAEKLANELELLDGLRLSVQHCEEVIAANKDRYPILEHTNAILEEQIANLEADIETTNAVLEKIREKEGKGGNK